MHIASPQDTRPSSSIRPARPIRTGFPTSGILLPAAILGALHLTVLVLSAAERPAVFNTQPESIPRMSAADAVKGLSLPPGFNATVFAQEPDVQQPIAIATDSRGRLWVAENYTYSESGVNFHPSLLDQIVILEDADHDGRAEKRTVFWDQARKLTGLVPGLGGVYALCPPQLLFLADRDGDDRPDGPPEVLLDGWNDNVTRHTIVNGLKWGPDGWLYGRQGIQATSQVGRPGAAEHERIPINVGLWRFHPRTHRFETLCHGTTNPWGHDWDEHGQLFFINTVIGHLWHVVPGAHYRRMYGEHFNPHLYEVIEQTADHFHWDTREIWHEIRKLGVSDGTSKAGGGHAHSGLMIYLGDNWPRDYRNRVFAMNYHGRRINQDILERKGAGYVGRHGPDFMHMTDPWFRGIDLLTGPDGGVFVADWSDIGECHDHDGIHRTSGRIYKITHGTVRRPEGRDIRSLNENDLADLHRHPNEWQARQARLALQERFYNGRPMVEPRTKLIRWVQDKDPASLRLRALWGLHVTGGVPQELLLQLLDDESEALRVGSIQLLTDQATPTAGVLERFARMAHNDTSGLVLAFLASAMGKAPIADRWPLAAALSTRSTFAADPTLPLLTWYGIQPAILADPQKAMELAKGAVIPKIQQFTTRHLCEDWDSGRVHAANLLSWASNPSNDDVALSSIVLGISQALEGRRKAEAPPGWSELGRRLRDRASAGTQTRLRELDLLFGEGRAAEPLRKLALDPNQGAVERRHALRSLVQSRADGTVKILGDLLADRDLAEDAISGLATLGAAETPSLLLGRYADLRSASTKLQAWNALASRRSFADALMQAVIAGKIPAKDAGVLQVRQLQSLGGEALQKQVRQIWPELSQVSAEKSELMLKHRSRITPAAQAAADLDRGKALFVQNCGSCHKLFGQGGAVGPDLTGSDRKNIDYLLDNLVDPSGIVPEGFRASTVELKDGRLISGIVSSGPGPVMSVQTATELLRVERSEVQSVSASQLSLMPAGLLDALTPAQANDLFRYLTAE